MFGAVRFSVLLLCLWGSADLLAQQTEVTEQDPLSQLLRKLALDLMPRTYEDTDDWGKTKEFVTGLHVHREGLKIETRRKHRRLNHGRWERYSVSLRDEEAFELAIRDVHATEGGRTAFTLEMSAPIDAHLRRANWRRGVQLWSVSADATADVKLTLFCTSRVRIDTTELPPAVVLEPEVIEAEIELTRFQLTSISKLGRDIADEIGDALRSHIRQRAAAKDGKLVTKINSKIEKKQDRLRLTLGEWAKSPLKTEG